MNKSTSSESEIGEIVAELRLRPHRKKFNDFSERASVWASSPVAFFLALVFVIGWTVFGIVSNFSHTWEVVLSCVPTIVTFLLVFLIQSSQSRETLAVQLKLNELIRATSGAHTIMLSLEKLTGEELSILCRHYETLAHHARQRMKRGETDGGSPDLEGFPSAPKDDTVNDEQAKLE